MLVVFKSENPGMVTLISQRHGY